MIKSSQPAPIADESSLRISPFLQLWRRADGKFVGYHALFGNCGLLDAELGSHLIDLADSPREAVELRRDFGADVFDRLYEAYYLTNGDEERAWTEKMLADRAAQVEDGGLVGGLQITSSNLCNFSCSYCFADASDRRSPHRAAGADTPNISFETAAKAIDQVLATARQHGRDRIGVKFLGREPLVNFRVIEQLFARYEPGQVAWSVTTNGSLVTPAVARRLQEVGTRVVVSVDGPANVNDRHRTLKSAGGSAYDRATAGLAELFQAGVACGVSSVVTANTDFAEMPEFLETIQGMGCREIELTLVMQSDALRAQRQVREPRELARLLAGLYRIARRLGLYVSGDWVNPYHAILVNRKLRTDPTIYRPGGAGCQATEHQLSLEPNGDLFPCRAMSLHYGTLSDWQSVLKSEAYRKVAMRTFYNVPYCHGCELEGHCQGTCLGSLEEAGKDIYSPQVEYCDVYRSATQLLLERTDFDAEVYS